MSYKHKAWLQYEAGKNYKRRIGLYETIRENERFYRGDQWHGSDAAGLPKPVFNVIKRVIDYLVCTVAASNISIGFDDAYLPFATSEEESREIGRALEMLEANAAYRWDRCSMDSKILRLITDAAITGDGVFYCYWDPNTASHLPFSGDIVTETVDNVNLFVADVNCADIQKQEYIILAGRASVSSLRAEAEDAGGSPADIKKILPDKEWTYQSGDMAKYELEGSGDELDGKATYIIKFWREKGKVLFEKSTADCIIRRAKTDCRLYPVAYFNWTPTKNSFHGTSPITSLIPNQKYINRAYAMVMKHMTDTAFSKVVYDKSKIPEWSNEVGEAIAAMGGGNISDAVSVVGVGRMQDDYLKLIELATDMTKDLLGATDSALGSEVANNTSAILALQETSRIPLEQVRTSYYRCIEELANIWADMMCAYYPAERLVPIKTADGTNSTYIDIDKIKRGCLSARIDVVESTRFNAVNAQNMLDKLLDGGYITAEEYVKRLPASLIINRNELITAIGERNSRKVIDGEEVV
ncbi:MAG: hypothetical protein J6Q78_04245 [Clostridia bacterium]|nr:hypothetical protein [Clostridia bacterium]